MASWIAVCLPVVALFSTSAQEKKPPLIIIPAPDGDKAEDDELVYVSPPPPPLPDFRKLAIDKTIRQLLADSGLPPRRKARLLRMASGAYLGHRFQPFWLDSNPDIVIERVSDALRSHALDPFAIPDMFGDELPFGPIPKTDRVTVDDVRLTLQVAEAALLLKEGPATEKLVWEKWNQGDTPGTIATAVHTENVTRTFSGQLNRHVAEPERVLDAFVPQNWIYERLRKAWLISVSNPNPDLITFRGNAYRGKRYSQARELAETLEMLGFLSPEDAAEGAKTGVFTTAMSYALRDFQRANGLRADGIFGPKTMAKLKRDPNRDRQRIVLNLHRARLVPNEMGDRYVMVNLPSGEIFGFENGHQLGIRMRIVFGRNTEDRRTPIFRDTLEEVIFRPYWWVPKDIAVNEYLHRGPGSLSRSGYEIVRGGFADARSVRMTSSALRGVASGDLILRQRAGYGNALGLVKFRFPNDHAVYFHDTPQKHLFQYSDRAHSHGCMRLEKPRDMAEWVLKHDPDWSSAKIQQAMRYGNRNVAEMKQPMHVFVVYFTVFPLPERENGIAFLKDVYNRDMTSLEGLVAAQGGK
ncbi:MAG: L,D-transpeptidase family protein [Verrucomicrobiales bacterium]|nr:L,D-transpeptidase family protein [Verrucomicrobiales bacterium]